MPSDNSAALAAEAKLRVDEFGKATVRVTANVTKATIENFTKAENALHAAIDALQAAASQREGEVMKPVGWLYDWTHSSALGKPDEDYTGFTEDEAYAKRDMHRNARLVYALTAPATSIKAQAGDSPEVLDGPQ